MSWQYINAYICLYLSKHRCWTLVITRSVFEGAECESAAQGQRSSDRNTIHRQRVFEELVCPSEGAVNFWSSLKRQTERLIWDYKRSASVPRLDLGDPPPRRRREWISAAVMRRHAHVRQDWAWVPVTFQPVRYRDRCSYPTVPFYCMCNNKNIHFSDKLCPNSQFQHF